MMPAWAAQYVGLPFAERGRTRDGVDCYGLVRLIYQEQRRIELPSYTESYATTQDVQEICGLLAGELGIRWRQIALREAQVFDGVIFRVRGQPTHVGLVLEAPWFIHAIKDGLAESGRVCVERWDALLWVTRMVGVVRWQME